MRMRQVVWAVLAWALVLLAVIIAGKLMGMQPALGEVREVFKVRDTYVVDGDTVKLRHIGEDGAGEWITVRLFGIDAPEVTRAGCERELELGLEAKMRMRQLLDDARDGVVVLVRTPGHDKYGRVLGRLLTTDATPADLGAQLVKEDKAVPYEGRGKRRDWCRVEASR